MVDLFVDTLLSLRAHALRFGLTSLGIVWGAFMLTYLSASMEGVDAHFTRALQKMGPKIVYMGGGAVIKARVGERGARRVLLDEDDNERIVSLQGVENASPSIDLWNTIVQADRRTKLLHVQAVNHEAASIRNFQASEGRFLRALDVERAAKVAFLGSEAAERLFGRKPALGRSVRIEGVPFRVVGIAVPKGAQLIDTVNRDDRKVMIPYTTAQRWITRSDDVSEIVFGPQEIDLSWDAIRRVREITAPHHDFHPDSETALWFFNIHDVLQLIHGMLLALRVFLIVAGITTLLVGAVGVMNIMLVVVGERTNEIGLRKAVGASSRAIFVQFLAEAAAVCLISGLVGTALGIGLSQFTARVLPRDSPFASIPILDPSVVVTITAALVLVGIVAGMVPAIRASQVPPAEALRAI